MAYQELVVMPEGHDHAVLGTALSELKFWHITTSAGLNVVKPHQGDVIEFERSSSDHMTLQVSVDPHLMDGRFRVWRVKVDTIIHEFTPDQFHDGWLVESLPLGTEMTFELEVEGQYGGKFSFTIKLV